MGHDETKLEFETGAHRSKGVPGVNGGLEPRYDAISWTGLRRLAVTYAEGIEKHGRDNWRNGFPVGHLLNRAIGHLFAYLDGDTSEPHLEHAAWGIFAAMEMEERRPDMIDVPPVRKAKGLPPLPDTNTPQW